MPYYNFAGIHFGFQPEDLPEIPLLRLFKDICAEKPDILVYFRACDILEEPFGKRVLSGTITEGTNMILTDRGGEGISFHLEGESSRIVLSRLDTDSSWNNIAITYLARSAYFERYALKLLGNLVLKNKIIFYNGLVVHASAVMHNGKGIIFSAPSGTGKSTHARLWEHFLGARIINDDSPALRIIDNRVLVFGTPWSGSTTRFENSQVPLAAIVILEQSNENKITVLNSRNAVNRFLPQCYIPFYNRKMCEMALETFGSVTGSLPVYLLQCRPEKEAMDLVYQCIK